MPLYEYLCRACNTQFEQLVFNTQTEIVCRKCGNSDVKQLLSTFAVGSSGKKSIPEGGPCSTCGAAERGQCQMM